MTLKRTSIFPLYAKYNARVVSFAGWEMPIQFKGIVQEHLAVRNSAGLFDTSHMGEIFIRGEKAFDFAQRVFCNDLSRISPGKAQYGAFLNPLAGFIDDVIAYLLDRNEIFFCVNASNTEKDYNWLKELAFEDGQEVINLSDEYAQLALQGPLAKEILKKLTDAPIDNLEGFSFIKERVAGIDSIISRTGYTGEDGFELFIPSQKAQTVFEALVNEGEKFALELCGLGARDTLRLEMGYPLYGHELNEEITPIEAGLSWIVGWKKRDFIGKDMLDRKRYLEPEKKRVGIKMLDQGIARENYKVVSKDGEEIGTITSGTKTASLDRPVAMAYLKRDFCELGTKVYVVIRGNPRLGEVVKLPFYEKRSS